MLKSISKCNKCKLCLNQKPLLDNINSCDVMWVGLSAKKVLDVNKDVPLSTSTNSGKIIESIEKRLPNINFYKTNLVKCLPLDKNNKLRYPSKIEMNLCIENLLLEIKELNPKIIFALGKNTYDFINKYFSKNNISDSKLVYINHPSYIYVYKRKYIEDYIKNVLDVINKKV